MVKVWLFLFVLLLSIGHASAVNMVTNGDFENNLTSWTFIPDAGGSSYAQINSVDKYEGSYSATLYSYGIPTTGVPWYAHVYQDIDLTSVSNLTLMLKSVIMHYDSADPAPEYDTSYFEVYINNTQVYHVEDSTFNWSAVDIDVSSYSGVKRVYFRVGGVSDMNYWKSKVYVDNIVADDGVPQTINVYAKLTQSGTPMYSTGITCGSDYGFTTENGEVFLKPEVIESKKYTMELTDNDLQDGFKLEVSALGTDVSKIIVTTNDLIASRNYDVYLDDQWIEKIGEVTEYQYNITSFSLHTLELVHATGEEEEDGGGGSGPIPDEDEMIIEDDVITIGELTITKEEFKLLTIEQIEALNISQDVKNELIRIKSINVDWWKIVLGLCLMATVIEGSRKEGNEIIIVVGAIGVIIAAYKLGYFQL